MRALSRIVAAICITCFVGLVTFCEAMAGEPPMPDVGKTAAIASSIAPLPSDQAWVGEYRVVDGQGERSMTVIRSASQVEYRLQNAPIRVWRQVGDGVELRELHPDRGQMIAFAPGDLRAYRREPEWAQIASLVNPALRDQLTEKKPGKAFGDTVRRYRGNDAQQRRIELDWLSTAMLPAAYRLGPGGKDETIELRALRRVSAATAFTTTEGMREIDGADDGD